MTTVLYTSLLLPFSFILFVGCFPKTGERKDNSPSECSAMPSTGSPDRDSMRGALLGTRFRSLEQFSSLVEIEYEQKNRASPDTNAPCLVRLRYCRNEQQIVSVVESGISQQDILKARQGSFWDRLNIVYNCPDAVRNRKDLGRANALSRWRPQWFGEGDIAFFDIAKLMTAHIDTPELAFRFPKDSTEKGYLNSFNHVTSQAFFTSCFSEELADFIGDAHERAHHPEIITGRLTDKQKKDLEEGPVDNYTDVLNNEWGQQIGEALKAKYNINHQTQWSPQLLANYLNDLQSYFSWAFQIGFSPFRPEEETVQRFCIKLNEILHGNARNYD